MCGICGIVARDRRAPVDEALLRRMAAAAVHRGPDGEGFHLAPGVGLGFRRLSIIDLEGGQQPIASEDGLVHVVCNGEIYNHIELRAALCARGHLFRTHSDAEVIVHLYEEHGDACLEHLRGMFGLAVWDERRGRLLLARDRPGIKPLCYAETADALYFASEVKSLLPVEALPRDADPQAILDVLRFGFVQGPRTGLRAVQRLPPGHLAVYEAGRLTVRPYWEYRFPAAGAEPRQSPRQWAEAFRERLAESVRLHLRSDVPVGTWLSGGIDSSAVTALMCRASEQPVPAFTIRFPDHDCDEFGGQRTLLDDPSLRLVPHMLHCPDHALQRMPEAVWWAEAPMGVATEIPRLMLAQLSAQHVKVVLSGEGADEVLGGYTWYATEKILRLLSVLPPAARAAVAAHPWVRQRWPKAAQVFAAAPRIGFARFAHWIGPVPTALHAELERDLIHPELLQAAGGLTVGDERLTLPDDFPTWHPHNQLLHLDFRTRMTDAVIHGLDRMSMAHSLEVRVPFLDHPFVEFCAGIPPALKMTGLREKTVLRRAMRGVLPGSIRRRPKFAFISPFDHWLCKGLPGPARELLLTAGGDTPPLFRPEGVRRLLEEHSRGQRAWGRLLLGILGVRIWHEQFVRRRHVGNWG
jgi:asparagine synthase (glutamine-hydrolysing)